MADDGNKTIELLQTVGGSKVVVFVPANTGIRNRVNVKIVFLNVSCIESKIWVFLMFPYAFKKQNEVKCSLTRSGNPTI